jgi:hypothetical protein
VSANNPKPSNKPGADGTDKACTPDAGVDARSNGRSGRVKFDDRGNAVWEWAIASGAYDREVSTQRLHKLEHPALSLADDAPTPSETVRANPLGTKKGYDPYDSGKLAKAQGPRRKKDLRRLGEFFKLKKQVAGSKDDE